MDVRIAAIAAAIGEPARVRMLECLMDGRARTSTELAIVAEVSPSTASVHLHKLASAHLVKVAAQGRSRYYSLHGQHVANALEGLIVLAGSRSHKFEPTTPDHLRAARTCYDHIAGTLGVALRDRLHAMRWIDADYAVTQHGAKSFVTLGINVDELRDQRRRFAYACLDWSERRPHIGGALGAALLAVALKKKWVRPELDSRALAVTAHGRAELKKQFGLE